MMGKDTMENISYKRDCVAILTLYKVYFKTNNINSNNKGYFIIIRVRDFPGGPVAKTVHFQCRGPGFDPWSGN